LKTNFLLLLALACTFFLFSCSKNDNTPTVKKEEKVIADEKVYIKIEVENGELTSISSITNGNSEAQAEVFSNKKSFSKEYKSVSVVNVSAKGVNASSNLTVKILKGDKILRESTSTGAEMSAVVIN
jgi:hypothetical protein